VNFLWLQLAAMNLHAARCSELPLAAAAAVAAVDGSLPKGRFIGFYAPGNEKGEVVSRCLPHR